jgi:hypothetical protein
MAERQRVLNVRMTESEMEMVKALSEAAGLSQSDAVRQIVRRAHEELRAKAKPKPNPKK